MKSWNSSKIANALVAVVLTLVPFHAFLTVWASTIFGHFLWLRLWDELILSLALGISAYWLITSRKTRNQLKYSKLFLLIASYIGLTFLVGLFALSQNGVSQKALGYALIVNLRFFIWFLCVWLIAARSPWLQKNWRPLFFAPLAAVVIFAILQFFVLPHNFLAHFGYGKNTFVPYITINQDSPTIRVQSFLRGTNPLGAYLVVAFGLLVSQLHFSKKDWPLWLLLAGSILALAFSFSRSGWIGVFVATVVAVSMRLGEKNRIAKFALAALAAVVIIGSLALAFRNSAWLQDSVLHVNKHSTAIQTSNEGHLMSLNQSLSVIYHHPQGNGPGTAGQASWYNKDSQVRNTESYFLQITEEVGLIGLILFMAILLLVGYELWLNKSNELSLGLLAALTGLLFVAIFSYAWNDDTLAYVWWGLAGIALAPKIRNRPRQEV